MIKLTINQQDISFQDQQKLWGFEDEVCDEIKKMLNASYPNISVKETMTLGYWNDFPVRVTHNASNSLECSNEFIENFNKYLSTRDDIDVVLSNRFTLVIELVLSKNENRQTDKNNMNEENKDLHSDGKKETIVEFFPSKPRYNFDQIILEDSIKKEVFDALKVIECKELIYNAWGFSEVDPIPRSILNFYGEPGTGKTMCAHAIADRLGKSIMALNYSEIESKFVGEAPKNLQKAFDTAKQTGSVLFFDEADSFLGKRIENVSQGADQALNSLRSQMLIMLEEFPGVVLFATNLVTNFDPAFESRILKHIRFELPNQEARAAIIKKMLPSRLPVDAPFTNEQYLEASALIEGFSGREIKGAILDLLLSKAESGKTDIVFCFDDLCDVLKKKQKAKKELKAEEERRIKNKIEKKLKEKATENEALKNLESGEPVAESLPKPTDEVPVENTEDSNGTR